MTVLSCEFDLPENADEAGADGTISCPILVTSDDFGDRATEIFGSALVPAYGDLLSAWDPTMITGNRFRLIRRRIARDGKSRFHWRGECTFSTKFGEHADRHVSPVDRRPTVKVGTRKESIAWYRDAKTGELNTNTVGDHFVPVLQRQRSLTTYNVQLSLTSHADWLFDLRDTCNKNAIDIRGRVWEPYTLYLDTVEVSDEGWHAGDFFYAINYTILADPLTHKEKILNDGLTQLVNGVRKPCLAPDGKSIAQSPQMLAANGQQIKITPSFNWQTDPHYLEFHPYDQVDWLDLVI